MEDKHIVQIRNVLVLIAVIIICAVLKVTASVSINVLLAIFLFFIFLPLAQNLDRRKIPSWITTILVVLLIIVFLVVVFFLISYLVSTLIAAAPKYSARVIEIEREMVQFASRFVTLPENYSILGNIDWVSSVIMPALRKTSSSLINLVSNGVLALIMAIFLLVERNTIVPKLRKIAAPESREMVTEVWSRLNQQFTKYIGLKVFISALTGIFFYITCSLMKVDFAALIGVLTFVLNFIPTFGSIAVTAFTIIISILQFFPSWIPILIVSVSTITIQMVLGNIIEPRMQGTQLNLSPFAILVSLSVFGYIFGLVGLFLAVPVISMLEIILANMEGSKGVAVILSSTVHTKRKKKTQNFT